MQKSYPFFPSSLFLSIVTYVYKDCRNFKYIYIFFKKRNDQKQFSLLFFKFANSLWHQNLPFQRPCQLKNSNSPFNPSNSSMLKPNFHLVFHHKLFPLEDANET